MSFRYTMTMLLFKKKHEISIRFLHIYKSTLCTVKDLSSMNVNLYSVNSSKNHRKKNGVKCIMQLCYLFVFLSPHAAIPWKCGWGAKLYKKVPRFCLLYLLKKFSIKKFSPFSFLLQVEVDKLYSPAKCQTILTFV